MNAATPDAGLAKQYGPWGIEFYARRDQGE